MFSRDSSTRLDLNLRTGHVEPSRRHLLAGVLATGGIVSCGEGRTATRHSEVGLATESAACAAPISQFILSLRDRNVTGDGRVEDATAIQLAYDEVAKRGGILFFPAGTYVAALNMWSRRVALLGEGINATTLVPAHAGSPVLRATFIDSHWELVTVKDLAIDGRGVPKQHGFVFGKTDDDAKNVYVGRVAFERVSFYRLATGIVRPFGNIGVHIDQCSFRDVEFGVECRSHTGPGSDMHAGTMFVTRSYFTGFTLAALFVDNQVVGGQITISDCVFEAASGFLLFISRFNGMGPLPGICLQRSWIENVATGMNVSIDGQAFARVRCIFACDCSSPISVIDSPIGDVQLIRTTMITENCALDSMIDALVDSGSQLLHRDARQFSGLAPGLCRSIVGPTAVSGLRTPWFRMPRPRQRTIIPANNVLMAPPTDTTLAVAGAFSQPGIARLEGPGGADFRLGHEFIIPRGQNLFHQPMVAIQRGRYVVALYIYRLMKGGPPSLQISGQLGLSGRAVLSDASWQMIVNISQCVVSGAQSEGFLLTGGSADSVLQVAGLALLGVDTLEQAIAIANSGEFPAHPASAA